MDPNGGANDKLFDDDWNAQEDHELRQLMHEENQLDLNNYIRDNKKIRNFDDVPSNDSMQGNYDHHEYS